MADRLERERAFHDELATHLDPAAMPVAPLESLDAAVLQHAEIGPGMRVLDLGCGSGDLTLHLISTGADVTALDLSPGMVDIARRRVALHGGGGQARFVAAAVEDTGFPDGEFDVVIGRFILHHLDVGPAGGEIARILRPGGRAVFAENSGRNPLLMFARRHVAGRFGIPRLGTDDEHPLSETDIAQLSPSFTTTELSYPVFEVLRIFDRQVLRFRFRRITRVLRALDELLGRSRRLAPYSFRVLVTLVR